MIIAFIFLLHIFFLIYVFIKRLKTDSVGIAFQNAIFIIIIFSVGWTLISFVINLLIEPAGFGKLFNRNTISLSILTIVEIYFYWNYYKNKSANANDKGKQ